MHPSDVRSWHWPVSHSTSSKLRKNCVVTLKSAMRVEHHIGLVLVDRNPLLWALSH